MAPLQFQIIGKIPSCQPGLAQDIIRTEERSLCRSRATSVPWKLAVGTKILAASGAPLGPRARSVKGPADACFHGVNAMTSRGENVMLTGSSVARDAPDVARALPASALDSVLIRDRLREDDLLALMAGEIVAIRIKDYFPAHRCAEIADRLVASRLYGRYINANAIGRVGQAFFESQADEKSRARYERDATEWIKELRERCDPYLTPVDKFRLELDEAWTAGARVATMGQRKMFAGLARHFAEGSEAEPHQDVFAWDAPGKPEAMALKGQLAWNTYLTIPEKGGELVLWDVALSREQYDRQRVPKSYGVGRETLPEPVAVLKPEQGEMILFNAGRVHAVAKIEVGSRVTWSAFVGYAAEEYPLIIWS